MNRTCLLLLITFILPAVYGDTHAVFSERQADATLNVAYRESPHRIKLEITFPAIELTEIRGEDGTDYHGISMPDTVPTQNECGPQLPCIRKRLRVPAHATNITARATVTGPEKTYPDILPLPCPRSVMKKTDDGYDYIAEEFCMDGARYKKRTPYPENRVEIAETGFFRSEKLVTLNIYPVVYTAAVKKLSYAPNMTVTVTWDTDSRIRTDRDTTTGFKNMLSGLVLNYKATDKKATQERSGGGSVTYQTDLLAEDIVCDYLIVTHSRFCEGTVLNDFAQYRANKNGLAIVIATVDGPDGITAQYPHPDGTEYSIKSFVEHVYETWRGPDQQHNPADYLLIVGDVEYVPSRQEMLYDGGGVNYDIIDYEDWYVCINGPEDMYPDLAMGRLSVKNITDLSNVYNKIVSYEQTVPLHKALHVEGTHSHQQNVVDLFYNNGFEVTEIYERQSTSPTDSIEEDVIAAMEAGCDPLHWHGHGFSEGWEIPFDHCILQAENSVYPVILTTSCSTADLGYNNDTRNSIGENAVRAEAKSAVAYYGATVPSGIAASDQILREIFDHHEYNLGKAMLYGEFEYDNWYLNKIYILVGDPALRVFGYATADTLSDLTISSSDIVYDYTSRQLTIRVDNIGAAGTEGPVHVDVYIVDPGNNEKTYFAGCDLPAIAAGAYAEMTITDVYPPFKGLYPVIAVVDPGDLITESCEINNQNGAKQVLSPTFIDATNGSGLDLVDEVRNAAAADINGDGYKDLYITTAYGVSATLLLNNGDGTFTDISDRMGEPCDAALDAAFGDIDNDGDPDLFVCKGSTTRRNILFLNQWRETDGAAPFIDVTAPAGITGASKGCIFGDVDGNGYLDIYLISDTLYINNGDLTFSDETAERGLSDIETYIYGNNQVVYPHIADIDNDGDPDLLVVNETPSSSVAGAPRLYWNDGEGYFTPDNPQDIINLFPTKTIAVGDINLDGKLDLFLRRKEHYPSVVLQENPDTWDRGFLPHLMERLDVTVSDRSVTTFGDIDNNPGEDLLWGEFLFRNSQDCASPVTMFRNDEPVPYDDAPEEGAAEEIYDLLLLDLEMDGDLDLIRNDNGTIRLFRNMTNDLNWIEINLIGIDTNRDALGAKVYLHPSTQPGAYVGSRHVSTQTPAPLRFGLPANDTYTVIVHWPGSGMTEILYDISPTQLITVVEGSHLSDTADYDNDGLSDFDEQQHGTNPLDPDTDDDTMPDSYEVINGLDPLRDDSHEDLDNDGCSNFTEYLRGTDPSDPDDYPPHMYVDAAAAHDGDGSAARPYRTIQEAIDNAYESETVIVAEGTYYENVDFRGKAVTVRSEAPDDHAAVAATVIDGGRNGPAVTFSTEQFNGSMLAGFTIQNGYAQKGGGVSCINASPLITRNVIKQNDTGGSKGGGIYCESSEARITNNRISGNTARNGSGMYIMDSSLSLENNIIVDNARCEDGGGVFCLNSSLFIANTTIADNFADMTGSGICFYDSTATVVNSIIWGNATCYSDPQLYTDSSSTVDVSYSCVELDSPGDVYPGESNINADPLFRGGDPFDYRLAIDSPCIDTGAAGQGVPDVDLDGMARPFDLTGYGKDGTGDEYDMGAYELGHKLIVTVELGPTISMPGGRGRLTRCIEFRLYDCAEGDSMTFSREISFTVEPGMPVTGVIEVAVPQGDYSCITARDPLHTLRQTDDSIDIAVENGITSYSADFTGDNALQGGDLNGDGTIDSVDYVLLVNQWGVMYASGDTSCDTPRPHADINGDGVVTIADFSFIQINYGNVSAYACCHGAQPRTLYVDAGNTTPPWDGSASDPYRSIQTAIENADNGDTVLVRTGTYTENIDFMGKAVTVTGTAPDDPAVVTATVIDAGGDDTWLSGVKFDSGEEFDSVLTGFTITNGYTMHGGGVYIRHSSPTLRKNVITSNTGEEWGGGIYCERAAPSISDTVITGNTAAEGAGLYIESGSHPTFVNNLITGNNADFFGGGIQSNRASFMMLNTTIAGNDAYRYGGLFCASTEAFIVNSILWGNSPAYPQIHVSGSSFMDIIYSCVQGGTEGEGNIAADPLFITGPLGNYYLSQIAAGQAENSPCIDSGYFGAGLLGGGTTRTDGVPDSGMADTGYHYPEHPQAAGNVSKVRIR